MRIATVVLPVPGLPVKRHVQRLGISAPAGRIRRRSLSITSSAAMSRMRVLDRCEPDEFAVELVEDGLDLALGQHVGD